LVHTNGLGSIQLINDPDEQEMLGKLKAVQEKSTLVRQAPAQQILGGYRDEIEKLLTEQEMTAKQV
jgi:hypothetical protein